MSNYLVDSADLTSVADAIRTKGGTSAALEFPDGFVDAVEAIETGGGDTNPTAPDNDVIFIDYDGTIHYSYTAAEFLALTELPPNPTHDGLVAQGWNWTLAEAKEYVASMGELVIGQLYTTESGATEIDIVLTPPMTGGVLGICVNGTAEIDFGDGSAKETVTGTATNTPQYVQHDWGSSGAYTIKIAHTGTLGFAGSTSGSYLFTNGTAGNNSMAYYSAVHAIRLGNGAVHIRGNAFRKLVSLHAITMSQNISAGTTAAEYYRFTMARSLYSITAPKTLMLSNYDFQNCSSLEYADVHKTGGTFFDGCYALERTNFGNANGSQNAGYSRFSNCYSLARIAIHNETTYISGNMFKDCETLQAITIPAGVTTIDTNAFQNCYSLEEVHLKPTTPPTLSSTNAFSGVPSSCVFYVPAGTLADYQAATNWSTYSAQMQEESA